MSAEKPGSRVLIIDGDEILRARLHAHFEDQGYQVVVAASGQAGLEEALNVYPRLILLALTLPDMQGQTVFHTLRSQPRTGHIPVMVLAGRDEAAEHKTLLEEGAYDVIEKPIDLDILTLRVRNALRRAEREGLTEARTGLPTGRLIDERLVALADQVGWTRIDLVIGELDTFRDLYGFVSANEVLRFAGGQILQIVNELGSPRDFVGHRANSETFVIITTQPHGARIRSALAERLTDELHSFHNFMEREQGYMLVDDGLGGQAQKPLLAVRMTVEQGSPDPNAEGDPWVDAVEDEAPDSPDKRAPDDSPDAASSPFDW